MDFNTIKIYMSWVIADSAQGPDPPWEKRSKETMAELNTAP